MKNAELSQIYQSVRKYASTFGNMGENPELIEICDFDDSYGFLFDSDDKYGNLYWCVNKKTYEPFSYRPNMDMRKYISRKVLSNDSVR